MNNTDLSRYSKRLVQYFWDPMPKNDSEVPIWCLGQQYESHPIPANSRLDSTGTSSASTSASSAVDSVTASVKDTTSEDESFEKIETSESVRDEGLDNGWPGPFLDDVEAKFWLTYRSNFPPIARSVDPKATSALSFAMRLKQMGTQQDGFTTDSGFGCMIRSGQSVLATTMAIVQLGRDWRRGQEKEAERKLLSLFADDPSAPFSIHKFVEHGAAACGKHPGEWFGPSATARCIQALTDAYEPSPLQIYVRPDDSDIYEDTFLATARSRTGDFTPTLVLLGTRLGIDRITPVYYSSLKRALSMPQSVGIAGGRPSSSHYFIGYQGDGFFYLDPHTTRPALPLDPNDEDIKECHTRRLRKIEITGMDPSMLLAFLIRSEDEWREWRKAISEFLPGSKPIVHVHDTEPKYNGIGGEGAASGERDGALDEVESCDDSDDETVIS